MNDQNISRPTHLHLSMVIVISKQKDYTLT